MGSVHIDVENERYGIGYRCPRSNPATTKVYRYKPKVFHHRDDKTNEYKTTDSWISYRKSEETSIMLNRIYDRQTMVDERISRNVNYSVSAYDSSDIFAADAIRFIDQLGDDSCYCSRFKYTTNGSMDTALDLAKTIAYELSSGWLRYEFHGQNTVYLYVMERETQRQILMVRIDDYLPNFDPAANVNRDMNIIVTGEESFCKSFSAEMASRVERNKVCRVTWKYNSGGRAASKTVMLDKVQPALTEFYPWLGRDIEEYYDSYIASSSNILLLLGEPGTGKTSFIRYLAYMKNMSTVITYDEAVIASDGFFVDFLSDDEHNMLVIEDAETLLTDRENDGNKIMSKLLNVSDGMIKVLDKKVIFTANLGDIEKVDRALVRPGRAFDVMMFRPLTFEEAKLAAEAAKLPMPNVDKDYTLAELFNKEETDSVVRNVARAKKMKVGFTA